MCRYFENIVIGDLVKKFRYVFILVVLFLFPIYVFAYDKVVPGGETIGIEVHSKGVLVVGFYKVDNKLIGKDSGFKIGDIITKINNKSVTDINSMIREIDNSNGICKFSVLRNNKYKDITMNLVNEDSTYKTGLYVKDQINGLGTLSFISPDKKFGGLGHEIMESNTLSKFQISEGEIYDASVSGIIKSYNGQAGEKNATYDKDEVAGTITENESTGIYGTYNSDISNRGLVDVGDKDNIKLGSAYIRTVIEDDKVEEFSINILNIDFRDETKNILFEIVDERLINTTGGVVQGMSGSPIMQDNKIIGVVNYVIVNEPTKGFGIFIESMLKEIE